MTSTPAPPPPRAMTDRIASDLADARRASRREARIRIIEAIAPCVIEAAKPLAVTRRDAFFMDVRHMVDALEAIAEPPVEKE
jgi:hypothetical protein